MHAERTVAVAELKAHLSAELRRVKEGETTVIDDHRKPVARLTGIGSLPRYARRSCNPFIWKEFHSLINGDIQVVIDDERADSW